jgi:hypothetical protein
MNLLNKITQNSKQKYNELNKKVDLTKKYNITLQKKDNESKIVLSIKKKVVLIGDINFYGLYNPVNKIWKWGNIITDIPRDIINYIEKIRMKGYTLETMKNNNQSTMFFYQFLNNDHMFIPDEKYLGLIIDLLLYLGEDLYIFTVPNNENELQLIGLKNINEIYV